MTRDVFVSYTQADYAAAQLLASALESRAFSCWIAPRDVPPGAAYGAAILEAIRASRLVVVLLSAAASQSPHVARELECAVSARIPILPVRLDEASPSSELQYFLAGRHWFDATSRPFDRHVPGISEAVASLGGLPSAPPQPAGPGGPAGPDAPDTLSFDRLLREPDGLIGHALGAYSVLEYVGRGGTGLVYRARHGALGRQVCLKLLYPLTEDLAGLTRAVALGVRGLAAVDHANVIKIFDLETVKLPDGSSLCIVMEFVPGKPLDGWSRELPGDDESVAARLRAGLHVLLGVQAAHTSRYFDESGFERVGLLHGDIKPSNVIVRPNQSPVLLDFMCVDVQRALDRRFRMNIRNAEADFSTGAFGTPGFMAPEQEERGVVTVKTDIYSLGATLMILFSPGSADWLGAWRRAAPNLGPLFELFARMVNSDPAARPADVGTIVNQLCEIARALYGVELRAHD